MDEKKEDRRIRRSKKLLSQALLSLMLEKDFKEISVRDITDRADLNRGTFYLHYGTPRDLLEDMENELVDNFAELLEEFRPKSKKHSHMPIVEQIFQYVRANEQLFRCLFLSSFDDVFIRKLITVITDKGFRIQRDISAQIDEDQLRYTFQFAAYGVVGALKKWFEEGMTVSPERMVLLIESMISPVFNFLLGENCLLWLSTHE